MKDLGAIQYPELWVEIWVKFQPGYKWTALETGGGQDVMKFFWVRSWRGNLTNNRFEFFGPESRDASPVMICDWRINNTGSTYCKFVPLGYVMTGAADGTNDYYKMDDYYGSGAYFEENIKQGGTDFIPWQDCLGDGNWHKINYFLKIDSAPGAGDGEVEFWFDGVLELRQTDVPWRESGNPTDVGWNEASIGGNVNNTWSAEENQAEQWLAVSSMKIYNGKPA
jgi:hypothetical protein